MAQDKPYNMITSLHMRKGTTVQEAIYLIFRHLAKGKSRAERVDIAREVARIYLEETAARRARHGPDAAEALAQRILRDNPIEN
jgi:hypothetical protein